MAKKGYILTIGADISAVEAAVSKARSEITDLGNNKVLIELDYDHGDISELRSAIQEIANYDPKVRVQVNYDLQSGYLKRLLEEQEADINMYNLLTNEKEGKGDLTRYISKICEEVGDGLEDGLSKVDLAEKLKKALDLSASYTALTDGKYIDDSILEWLDELQEQFKSLDDYEAKTNIFSGLSENISRNKTIIHGLQLQLEDLKKAGAIDTNEVIDFSSAEKATDAIREAGTAIDETKDKLSSGTKVKFFDGVSEQIYDTIEDAEKLDELFDRIAAKWTNIGFRSATDFTNKNGRVTDNLYDQLSNGMNGDTFGSGTYFGGDFAGMLRWGSGEDFDRNIFAANLAPLKKMLKLESDDMAYDLERAMQEIHAFIAQDIFPHDNYKDILNDDISDINSLFESNRELFETLLISKDQVSEFVTQQKEWLQQFKMSDGSISDALKQEESFGSKFIKYALGVNGIDGSLLSGNLDSSTLGTNVFDKAIAESLERLDFGNNKEIAQKFAEKVIGNILKQKAQNPGADLDETFRVYTGVNSKAFKSGDFAEMAKKSIFSENSIRQLYSQLEEAREIQSKATSLSFADLNKDWYDSSKVSDYIQKLERIQQLQNTIFAMKPDAYHGGSYEEAGKHIEKLNAQYEQTVAEIEKLREIDDGSQEIKEQIGLLENLAVAYRDAIEYSFPDDVAKVDWLKKYTNLSTKDLYGDAATVTFDRIKQNANNFRDQLQQNELDIFKEANFSNEDFSKLSQETINTSALLEIPDIMERITSATKEASQSMDEFHHSVNGDGLGGNGGVGSTTDSEVDRLREELSQAEADAEAERRRAADAEERAEMAEDESKGYLDANTRLSNELAEVRKEASERQEADAARIQELEREAGLKSDLYNIAVEDQSEANQQAKEYADLNRALQQKITQLESGAQIQQPSSATFADGAAAIRDEESALTALGDAASTAADKKELVASANSTLQGVIQSSIGAIRDEASALETLAKQAGETYEAKKKLGDLSNNGGNANSQSDSQQTTTRKKKDYEKEYLKAIDEYSAFVSDGQFEKYLPQEFASLRDTINNIEPNYASFKRFNDELQESKERLEAVKQGQEAWASAMQKGLNLSNKINSDKHLKDLYGKEIDAIGEDAINSSRDAAGATSVNAKVNDLSLRVANTISEFHKEASDVVSTIKTLDSTKSDYFKLLRQSFQGGDEIPAITSAIDIYEQKVASVRSRIEEMKDAWGENNTIVKETISLLSNYDQSMSKYTAQQLQTEANKQVQQIDKAVQTRQNQHSGYTPEFQAQLDNVRSTANAIQQELSSIKPGDALDIGKVKSWVQALEEGRGVLREINQQDKLLATEQSLNKLLRNINTDMSKGGLRGNLLNEYTALQQEVKGYIAALKDADNAEEALSKVDYGGLLNAYTHLNALARERGQLEAGFQNKFAEAINNQSAQFLATYFSFQDMIRYAREITSTVVQTDSALIELKKVSDASNERIQQSFTKSAETAQELGATITDVINSTSTWARLGYDVDAAEDLARTSVLFQTVGDNMTQETASESLVSTLKGFQMDADQAMSIVDKFNEVLAARLYQNANKDRMRVEFVINNNTLKLLEHPKANLPIRRRKSEKSSWMLYGEIKAFQGTSYVA